MAKIFLSYARVDGAAAALRLRNELSAMGMQVWRDLEEMHGGQAWKDQLRAALRTVDGVVVLLTPGAVASHMVEWEWENALTLQKRVIPLLMQTCAVPEALKALHYHNLSEPPQYTLGLAKLVRDLLELTSSATVVPPQPVPNAAKYNITHAENSAIGDDATTYNMQGDARADVGKIERVLSALAQTQAPSAGQVAEWRAILNEIRAK